MAETNEVRSDAALDGNLLLYRLPDSEEGWVAVGEGQGDPGHSGGGLLARGPSRYCPRSALGVMEAPSLLEAASHGPEGHWVLLRPARASDLESARA